MMRMDRYLQCRERAGRREFNKRDWTTKFLISDNSQESYVTQNDILLVICAIFDIFVTYHFGRNSK